MFFPDFENKASALVDDCSELSQKIKQKADKYYVRQISVDGKKYEIIKRIIDE